MHFHQTKGWPENYIPNVIRKALIAKVENHLSPLKINFEIYLDFFLWLIIKNGYGTFLLNTWILEIKLLVIKKMVSKLPFINVPIVKNILREET